MKVFPIAFRVFVVNRMMVSVKIARLLVMNVEFFPVTAFSRVFNVTFFIVRFDFLSLLQCVLSRDITLVNMIMNVSCINMALISRITLVLLAIFAYMPVRLLNMNLSIFFRITFVLYATFVVFLVFLAWLLSVMNNRFFLQLSFMKVVMLRMFKSGGYVIFQLRFVAVLSCLPLEVAIPVTICF